MSASVTAIRASVDEKYLTPEEVAERIPGMTVRALRDMRCDGRGPAYMKPTPRVVVYAESDVVAYMRRVRRSTREQS